MLTSESLYGLQHGRTASLEDVRGFQQWLLGTINREHLSSVMVMTEWIVESPPGRPDECNWLVVHVQVHGEVWSLPPWLAEHPRRVMQVWREHWLAMLIRFAEIGLPGRDRKDPPA